MDRLFLDANVLFSAAYRPDAGVARLWEQPGAQLVTSDYAVEEARRNLTRQDQRDRLDILVTALELVKGGVLEERLRMQVELPEKDWPILSAAVTSSSTHLITGDLRHFSPYFGRTLLGVTVATPADYLRGRRHV